MLLDILCFCLGEDPQWVDPTVLKAKISLETIHVEKLQTFKNLKIATSTLPSVYLLQLYLKK